MESYFHDSISDRAELAAMNALQKPVWIFDIEQMQMWWANRAAWKLWNSNSLEELLDRNWGDVSEATRTRLHSYLQQFRQGETVLEQWTFYPQGEAVSVHCVCSGIQIESGRLAMLVEGSPQMQEKIDSDILRGVEALRHTTVMISLYTLEGTAIMQNPAALRCYGNQKNASGQNAFSQRFLDSSMAEKAIETMAAGQVFSVETQVQTLHGIRWHGLDVRRTKDPMTGKEMILINEKDVTDRKQAEKKLQETLVKLAQANEEITALNSRLTAENLRLSAEVEITHKLQQMILPKESELQKINDLDIAGFMEPASEVGGDYYDVLNQNGLVKIGIGDVTGHGLESGVLMIMVQTAVRTLLENNETDPVKFLNTINRTIYDNVQRMNSDKNLTLSLLDYRDGKLQLSGQHEEMIVVRAGGKVELIDTIDLGFPIGLEADIADFITYSEVPLQPGDVVVLYTDGITEAENINRVQYGLDRLCAVVSRHWHLSASEIRQFAIADVRQHIGEQKLYDDITLLVLKKK